MEFISLTAIGSFFGLIMLGFVSLFGTITNPTLAICLAGLYVGSMIMMGLHDITITLKNK